MIVIKDMEMPSSCYDCPFAKNQRSNDYGSFCACGLLYETINLLEHSKHPNCPLIEQESCDDCISRFSAKQIIRNHYCSIPSKAFKKLIEELDSLSPVTPIRPKGHWIMTELPSRDAHTCSECGNSAFIDEWGNEQLTDFCPNCGAEMEEVEE